MDEHCSILITDVWTSQYIIAFSFRPEFWNRWGIRHGSVKIEIKLSASSLIISVLKGIDSMCNQIGSLTPPWIKRAPSCEPPSSAVAANGRKSMASAAPSSSSSLWRPFSGERPAKLLYEHFLYEGIVRSGMKVLCNTFPTWALCMYVSVIICSPLNVYSPLASVMAIL